MVKLLVDSSSDFTKRELEGNDVYFISIGITLDGSSYMDGIDITKDRFYELLTTSSTFPKTAMPSPAAFLEHFEKAKTNGDQVVCILLSSALSGTWQSAVTAKEMCGYDGIYIIDSRSAAGSIRILLDHAIRLRQEGACAARIAQQLESLKRRIRVYAALDTLEYLYRGGRLSRAAAAVGTIANLKPIVTIDETGKVSVVRKSLSRVRARGDLIDLICSQTIDSRFPVYSLYTCGTENCRTLEESLTQQGIHFSGRLQIGSAIGAHVGPEAFGVFFVSAG